MRRPLLALAPSLCVVALVAAPVPAHAQGSSPFGPVPAPQSPPSSPTPAPAPPSSNSHGGLGTGASVALLAVGGLLLAGIATVIVRDARRSTPRPTAGRRRERGTTPVKVKPASAPPGARGRPTGKGGAAKKRRRARGR